MATQQTGTLEIAIIRGASFGFHSNCVIFFASIMSFRDRKGVQGQQRQGRPPKRLFMGNQFVDKEKKRLESDNIDNGQPSTSRRKLLTSNEFIPNVKENFGYFIIEFLTVFCALENIVKCKKCFRDVTFKPTNIRGLGFKIEVICTGDCPPQYVNSGPFLKTGYEVNTRIVFAFRLLGIAHAGIQLFCGIMDMSSPIDKNTYLTISKNLLTVVENVAERVMKKSAAEEKKTTQMEKKFENLDYVSVSTDGSWMKRGFTSLFGIVVIIGALTGKVLDIVIKSAYCKVCEAWEKKAGTAEYEDYVNNHWVDCAANHEGSSGKMEVTGTVQLFECSKEKRGCIYKDFIGDGDSKTYKAVLEANPYGENCVVVKKECVGHVNKRMGTRLRNLVKRNKGLGGIGKLSGTQIDRLSDYYGKAIRSNSDDPQKMYDAIWATYYHRLSTDTNPQHHLCPIGEDSWCDYQRAKAKKILFEHTPKFRPSEAHKKIMAALKPIYTDLTKLDLLERCVGGHTQNANESFNSLVWQMAPKSKFSGTVHVQLAAYIAVCMFNEGCYTLLAIMDEAGMTVAKQSRNFCSERDAKRMASSDRKTAASTKEARIALHQARLTAQDAAEAEEGRLYGPGIDDT